jgi:hypothetical protein
MFVAVLVVPRLGWGALRRVAAIDAIEESVRVCAEKGAMLLDSTGSIRTTWSLGIMYLPGMLETIKLTSRLGAELGVKTFYTCGVPEVQLMALDYSQQGYIEAGRPELFDINSVQYHDGMGITWKNIEVLEKERPGAFLTMGNFGAASHMPQMETAVRIGAFQVGTCIWPEEISQTALCADYVCINEEGVAAGAYLSGDPLQGASLVAEDVAKLLMIALMIVGALAGAAGITLW